MLIDVITVQVMMYKKKFQNHKLPTAPNVPNDNWTYTVAEFL